MIKLTETDGGKVASGFPDEFNDCAVRALALSTKINYGDAHDMLRERGRRDRRGTRTAWLESSLTSLASLGVKWNKMEEGRHLTLAQFIASHRTGRYIVITRSHGLALIDGVIHDSFSTGARVRIRWAYQIELPVPAAITQNQVNSLWDRLNKLDWNVRGKV